MYEYKFIKIKLDSNWKGLKAQSDHHAIIEEHSSNGWRLVQIFTPASQLLGEPKYYELIFEKRK